MNLRACTKCKEEKPLDAFAKHKECTGGIARRCRSCDNAYLRAYYARNIPKRMLIAARDRARVSGVPFALKEEDIVIPDVCPVFKTKFTVGRAGGTDTSPNLDRIIPDLGYVRGNVIVISGKANRIKSNCTAEEIMQVGEWLIKTLDSMT